MSAWGESYFEPTSLQKLLETKNYELEDVLCDPGFADECRAGNQLLLSYLTKTDSLVKLLNIIITSKDDSVEVAKMSVTATNLIATENGVAVALFSNDENLKLFLDAITQSKSMTSLCACNLTRTLLVFVNISQSSLHDFPVVKFLLQNIENTFVADLCEKLWDPDCVLQHKQLMHILEKDEFLPLLLNFLSTVDAHETQIIVNVVRVVRAMLESRSSPGVDCIVDTLYLTLTDRLFRTFELDLPFVHQEVLGLLTTLASLKDAPTEFFEVAMNSMSYLVNVGYNTLATAMEQPSQASTKFASKDTATTTRTINSSFSDSKNFRHIFHSKPHTSSSTATPTPTPTPTASNDSKNLLSCKDTKQEHSSHKSNTSSTSASASAMTNASPRISLVKLKVCNIRAAELLLALVTSQNHVVCDRLHTTDILPVMAKLMFSNRTCSAFHVTICEVFKHVINNPLYSEARTQLLNADLKFLDTIAETVTAGPGKGKDRDCRITCLVDLSILIDELSKREIPDLAMIQLIYSSSKWKFYSDQILQQWQAKYKLAIPLEQQHHHQQQQQQQQSAFIEHHQQQQQMLIGSSHQDPRSQNIQSQNITSQNITSQNITSQLMQQQQQQQQQQQHQQQQLQRAQTQLLQLQQLQSQQYQQQQKQQPQNILNQTVRQRSSSGPVIDTVAGSRNSSDSGWSFSSKNISLYVGAFKSANYDLQTPSPHSNPKTSEGKPMFASLSLDPSSQPPQTTTKSSSGMITPTHQHQQQQLHSQSQSQSQSHSQQQRNNNSSSNNNNSRNATQLPCTPSVPIPMPSSVSGGGSHHISSPINNASVPGLSGYYSNSQHLKQQAVSPTDWKQQLLNFALDKEVPGIPDK